MLNDILEPRPPKEPCLSLALAVACLPHLAPSQGKRIDPQRQHFAEYHTSPQAKYTSSPAKPSASVSEEDPDDDVASDHVPKGCIPQFVSACEASKMRLAFLKVSSVHPDGSALTLVS